ncbi:hypothetical protein PENTCL1PPCAC_210, partial [Pristionchus entomophagus]
PVLLPPHYWKMWKSRQGGDTTNQRELPQDVFGSTPWIAASCCFIDWLLMLPKTSSTMADRDDIRNWLDDIFKNLFRQYEIDRLRVLAVEGEVLSSLRLLKGSFFALFFRLAVFDRVRDVALNAAEWLKRIRPILHLPCCARWLAPFASPHDAK